ncbi:hypothetical protein B0H14DRAFT_3642076 [Mycena olivaceomarginata]|nr:hypothetical protein B0H14DRAFT_3642076 [Mycena olivaceomarginata]
MSSELIFVRISVGCAVTGASGFLGSHVVLQLLEKGHRVRAAARGAKADHLKSSYVSYGDRLEVVKITDIAHDEFPEALDGVDGIIHIASPLPGRADPAEILAAAVEGTLNVVVQGEKAGVKRMAVTSSIATVINPKDTFTDQDWNPITREEALTCGIDIETYSASKTFAEKALWEWAEKHPHIESTQPSSTAPSLPHFPLPAPDFGAISTNLLVYNILFKDGVPPYHARHIDVRDVAKAHILALNSRPTAEVGRKRIVFSSPHGWPWQKTLDFIAEQRPKLKERFIAATLQDTAPDVLPMDFKRVEEVLGMKVADFYPIEETMLETVDALIQAEDQWRSAGHPIRTPPSF